MAYVPSPTASLSSLGRNVPAPSLVLKSTYPCQAAVTHTFNSRTREAEAGEWISSSKASSGLPWKFQDSKTHRETVLRNQDKTKQKRQNLYMKYTSSDLERAQDLSATVLTANPNRQSVLETLHIYSRTLTFPKTVTAPDLGQHMLSQ